MKLGLPFEGNWVDAARVPGMASGQATKSQVGAIDYAVTLDGLDSVMRARRIEAAMGAEQRADQVLIDPDQPDQDGAHAEFLMLAQACAKA